MTKFKLKISGQEGEKLAKEHGFDKFPINPRDIAEKAGIIVQPKPPEMSGISGALVFANDEVILLYSQEHSNPGFENFSIAHELGHYFLPGHPEEILEQGGKHTSRANFTENSSIELEADHFASGLLLPSRLVRSFLSQSPVGLDGIIALADAAKCSRTAAAIRAAECSEYPIAIVMSQNDKIAYVFMTDSFKALGELSFLRKGNPLPASATKTFNQNFDNVLSMQRICAETTLQDWFSSSHQIVLDEEVMGLGKYGYTLTILSSENVCLDPEHEDYDEDEELEKSWTASFAYGR